MSDRTKENRAQTKVREVDHQSTPYLDHGVPSSVALDNPDDSQLGAERTQSKGGR